MFTNFAALSESFRDQVIALTWANFEIAMEDNGALFFMGCEL
jgi:hypothetical protein